jgi:hypothetical protein
MYDPHSNCVHIISFDTIYSTNELMQHQTFLHIVACIHDVMADMHEDFRE